MEIKVYKVDVFTRVPLKGNPAAVVLDYGELDDKTMLAVASELNIWKQRLLRKLKADFM